MEKTEILERVLQRIPYPDQLRAVDINIDPTAVRFTWRGDRFRVSNTLMVESVENGFLKGDNKAILMEQLLKM